MTDQIETIGRGVLDQVGRAYTQLVGAGLEVYFTADGPAIARRIRRPEVPKPSPGNSYGVDPEYLTVRELSRAGAFDLMQEQQAIVESEIEAVIMLNYAMNGSGRRGGGQVAHYDYQGYDLQWAGPPKTRPPNSFSVRLRAIDRRQTASTIERIGLPPVVEYMAPLWVFPGIERPGQA